ncbi:MAG: hypothetical protein ACK4IX_05995 [Candidatus Sericytochromatia bacterium]
MKIKILLITSLTNNITSSTSILSNKTSIVHNVKGNTKAQISLKFSNDSFKTKASSSGNTNGTVSSISYYKVALCTDSNNPSNSMLSGSNFSFDKNPLVISNSDQSIVTFQNVPSGTFYATVSAFDINDNNITEPTFYSIGDILPLSVSSNSVSISTNGDLTPDGEVLTVNLKLRDLKGASLYSEISIEDGSNGIFGVN